MCSCPLVTFVQSSLVVVILLVVIMYKSGQILLLYQIYAQEALINQYILCLVLYHRSVITIMLYNLVYTLQYFPNAILFTLLYLSYEFRLLDVFGA